MYTIDQYIRIIQKREEQSLAKGEAKGKAEGIAEGKAETAKNMLKDGLPVETIVRYTGLTEAEVKALQ